MQRFIPLAVFLVLAVLLGIALVSPHKPSDRMRGQAFPVIDLPVFQSATLPDNGPRIVNFFASWCTPCIAELPYLESLSADSGVPLVGIAWKDSPDALHKWFGAHGNPFAATYLDAEGAFGISMGLRGLPETYVIGASGDILLHHQGAVTAHDLPLLMRTLKAIP